jgi:hypothetical protein
VEKDVILTKHHQPACRAIYSVLITKPVSLPSPMVSVKPTVVGKARQAKQQVGKLR